MQLYGVAGWVQKGESGCLAKKSKLKSKPGCFAQV